jgi:hypothetical protein
VRTTVASNLGQRLLQASAGQLGDTRSCLKLRLVTTHRTHRSSLKDRFELDHSMIMSFL